MLISQRFEADFASVGGARRFAVQALAEQGLAGLQDDVRTVVSELATNAVLHARTAFTVTLSFEQDRVQVGVLDESPVLPRLRRFGDPDSSTGRGLGIVAALSTTWGVTPVQATGKLTWCDFAVPAGGGGQGDRHVGRVSAPVVGAGMPVQALQVRVGDGVEPHGPSVHRSGLPVRAGLSRCAGLV